MEWRALPLLMLVRMDPSATVGGSSKEVGRSSWVNGWTVTGLVGVAVDEEVTVASGAEPGKGGTKEGGSILRPGLFGDGSRAVGERTRLA